MFASLKAQVFKDEYMFLYFKFIPENLAFKYFV